jgi:hypothetical protein
MRKVLLGIITLLAAQNVFAVAAYDLLFQQRNSTNTAYMNLIPASPISTDGILYFNQSTHLALWLAPGNFSNVSGVLSAKPLSTDITDSTVTGRSLLTSASAAAARTAIGAGVPVTLTSQLTNDSSFVSTTALTTALSNYPTNSAMTTAMSGKMDTPMGTAAQYLRGDASISNFNTDVDARVVAGIAGKENTIAAGTTSQYWRGDKTWQTLDKSSVGLSNVDNTSDASKPVSSAVTTALAGKFNAPAGTTSQYVRGDGTLATLPTTPARSFNYTTRALNTCFQPSSTRDALVSYSVDILTTISLATGQQGTVYLRTYTDSGCTTGTQEVVRFVNGQTGTLTIGLNISQNVTASLTGVIPAGLWVRLVTENNTSTPTFTARPGQEVLL